MLIWILILSLISCVLLSILLLRQWNLKKMNQQLQQIIEQFGTNELLRSNLPGKELNKLVTNVNKLISLFKQEERATFRQNQELKQEITNISHDIRTPLTSIKGFSELLQDPQLSNNEKEEYLAVIQKKVATLMETVNLFYEISRLESADENFKLENFSLGEVVVENLLAFQADFEKRNIDVKIEEENLFTSILGDKKGTERIILNVIQNALRYGQTFFQIKVEEDSDFLVLKTKNDGAPIRSEELAKIFDRSYTIDPSRQKGQTGLGLYIVKKIVEKQNGRVEATYEEGIFSLDIYFQKKKWKV